MNADFLGEMERGRVDTAGGNKNEGKAGSWPDPSSGGVTTAASEIVDEEEKLIAGTVASSSVVGREVRLADVRREFETSMSNMDIGEGDSFVGVGDFATVTEDLFVITGRFSLE